MRIKEAVRARGHTRASTSQGYAIVTSISSRWTLKGRTLLPIVQGGMGIGVSAHRLAGSVASLHAMGTISSVDLRQHHPDLLQRSQDCRDQALFDELNLIALDREIA